MRLLLLRHAIAAERADWGREHRDDAPRPLTDEGRKRMRREARALADLIPDLALVATSPLARCRETAEILVAAYPHKVALVDQTDLAPDGSGAGLLRFLQAQRALAGVACVGHEPNLSLFAGLLLTGRERSLVELKKGAGALIDFPARIAAGAGRLLWLLPPATLRALGGG
jgi:phosphohistidine phosphatase